jgi:hypothetical protein
MFNERQLHPAPEQVPTGEEGWSELLARLLEESEQEEAPPEGTPRADRPPVPAPRPFAHD